MKLRNLIPLVVLGVASLASTASAEGSYVALKAGIYSPSATFDVSNINVEETFEGDTETGVDAEIAFGHYFLPTVVLELAPDTSSPREPSRTGAMYVTTTNST